MEDKQRAASPVFFKPESSDDRALFDPPASYTWTLLFLDHYSVIQGQVKRMIKQRTLFASDKDFLVVSGEDGGGIQGPVDNSLN